MRESNVPTFEFRRIEPHERDSETDEIIKKRTEYTTADDANRLGNEYLSLEDYFEFTHILAWLAILYEPSPQQHANIPYNEGEENVPDD